MPDVTGIDHIYINVSDLTRSEPFYDRVRPVVGFRKSTFAIGGDPHVQYFNRHFGYVPRPGRSATSQYAPDYWATFCTDPDGIRLEVTNYRQERRDRHDRWDGPRPL